MVDLRVHIMGLKESSMLRGAPKKSNVAFQVRSFGINQGKFNLSNIVRLGFLASRRVPKGRIPGKPLFDNLLLVNLWVLRYNAYWLKYARQV